MAQHPLHDFHIRARRDRQRCRGVTKGMGNDPRKRLVRCEYDAIVCAAEQVASSGTARPHPIATTCSSGVLGSRGRAMARSVRHAPRPQRHDLPPQARACTDRWSVVHDDQRYVKGDTVTVPEAVATGSQRLRRTRHLAHALGVLEVTPNGFHAWHWCNGVATTVTSPPELRPCIEHAENQMSIQPLRSCCR